MYRKPEHLRRALRLKEDARVCLIGTGYDESLESFWIKSEPHKALGQIAALDLTFSTTTTYSVWDDHTRFDQIYNQERNLATYEWLTGHGVPTIPFLFCALEPDYKAAAKWLDEHPEVEIVATSAQGYKGSLRFCEFMADLRRLQQISNRPLRFLIVGCCAGWKIDLLYEHFPIAAIVSGLPFGVGRSGHLCNADLSGRRPAPQSIPRSKLVEECIATCASYCAARASAASTRKASEVIPVQIDLSIREAERNPDRSLSNGEIQGDMPMSAWSSLSAGVKDDMGMSESPEEPKKLSLPGQPFVIGDSREAECSLSRKEEEASVPKGVTRGDQVSHPLLARRHREDPEVRDAEMLPVKPLPPGRPVTQEFPPK
jgi:Domain of unknown function (DUF4417)